MDSRTTSERSRFTCATERRPKRAPSEMRSWFVGRRYTEGPKLTSMRGMVESWDVSPWLTEIEAPAPRLEGSVEADVGIIGAGLTGLSTALCLRERGVDKVAIVEAEVAGFGASGRNAGHLTPTIGKDLPTLAMVFGKERARELVAIAESAVAYTESLIERHSIDCHYEP